VFDYTIRVIKKNEVGGACSKSGRLESCIQGFGGEPERKRQFGRPRLRLKDIIKVDLQEVGWEGMV
jgi:hypothetical protein